MSNKARFLGWEIYLKTDKYQFDTEIVDILIGQDIASCFPMVTIKLSLDTSFIKQFTKPHLAKLTLVNRLVYMEEMEEIFEIDLKCVTNPSILVEREQDEKRSRITRITVKYMCVNGSSIVNRPVCGIYHKKKLEDIVKDLYDQTKCKLELKIYEEIENKTEYECIHIENSTFIQAIRYLNQKYGFYKSLFCTFGETFCEDDPKWLFGNLEKLLELDKRRDPTKLFLAIFEDFDNKEKKKQLSKKEYYIYTDVFIRNNFVQIAKRIPQMLKFISFDTDRFIKRKDIKVADTIKKIPFLKSNEQFDKEMEYPEEPFIGSRFDITDYSINHILQDLGLTAYQLPDIMIPNPIRIKDFRIGQKIEVKSKPKDYQINDLTFMVGGYLLHIRQGDGKGGGATWSTTFKIRPVATSYAEGGE